MVNLIRARKNILIRMEDHAKRNPKEECCGLLAGRDDIVTEIFPAINILASATGYEIAAEQLFNLFRAIRQAGLQHLGIYHSHVTGGNAPSASDIAQAYYPDVAYFIISPSPSAPTPIRAFLIQNAAVTELTVLPLS